VEAFHQISFPLSLLQNLVNCNAAIIFSHHDDLLPTFHSLLSLLATHIASSVQVVASQHVSYKAVSGFLRLFYSGSKVFLLDRQHYAVAQFTFSGCQLVVLDSGIGSKLRRLFAVLRFAVSHVPVFRCHFTGTDCQRRLLFGNNLRLATISGCRYVGSDRQRVISNTHRLVPSGIWKE
jgi:hypothetical protein